MPQADDAASVTLIFRKGLAERNRLPIEQVIKTLQEFRELVRELGRQVQRRNGVENPDGDFGIELVASATGLAFRKGSIKANAVATRDIVNAQETLYLIVNNVRSYSGKTIPTRTEEPEETTIARRMFKIGELQREAKTELAVQVKASQQPAKTGTLNERAIIRLEALSAPLMRVGGLTLFGRLRQLNDRSKEEEGGKFFWGELLTDASEIWRLRFPSEKVNEVLPLFRHQVRASGQATYFGNTNPRLDVQSLDPDEERDYIRAFDSLREKGEEIFGDVQSEELLRELQS